MTATSSPLVMAARQRAHDTRHRAVDTIRCLDAAGENVTFIAVARAASVSRSWLYRQADLRAEIDRIRTSSPATTATVPAAQRASTDSLRRRLEAAIDEITRLKADNHQLRQQVAHHYGQARATGHP
jgi:hypothetical protein